MDFFVPHVARKSDADAVYQRIRDWVAESTTLRITDRRIYQISYGAGRSRRTAVVGQPTGSDGDPVVAIREADGGPSFGMVYLVCTAVQGVLAGNPTIVTQAERPEVIDFS